MGQKFYVLIYCLLGYIQIANATHQVGGHLEMRPLSPTPGRYRIIVTHYLENNARGIQQGGGRLGIFRKRDNLPMTTFSTSETGQRKPIVFSNERCAQQRNLNFIVATFEADITLSPIEYSDPQGYYISYQTRNRNGGIDNISNPLQTGYTFYLEFPPLMVNGQLFMNGSPRFPDVNGEYICLNDPFSFAFGGVDPDGDELRYSMVNPLNQLGTSNNNTNNVSPGPYPDVRWAGGFSADNAIPGNPPLQVNSGTGELTVTASRVGLFVFAVRVEEYRNGQRIGEVRRDFQLLVVDCPPVTNPKALVQAKDQPPSLTSFTVCPSTTLTLIANTNPTWYYQWQRDGLNLPGDTLSTLETRLPGSYEVVVSSKNSCVKASKSQSMSITVIDMTAALSDSGHLCATTGTVALSVTTGPDRSYQWLVNGLARPGNPYPSVMTTQQPGRFQAEVTNTRYGCKVLSNVWVVERSAAVQATLGSSQSALCPGGTLTLQAQGGVSYVWQQNSRPIAGSTATYEAQNAGTYSLTAIDRYGCIGEANPLLIGQISPITVTLAPVPPVCGTANPAAQLNGFPPGGDYAGTGVTDSQFEPAAAGIGDHALTYTVRPASWCPGVVARQVAVVAPIPTIVLPDTIKTWQGNTLTVEPELTGNPNQFLWQPNVFLQSNRTAELSIVNIAKDTLYRLLVMNAAGCTTQDSIRILVFSRIWMPDAFTPNFDGQNDVWELKGVEGFTQAEVTVFNRWGEVVYWSNDGYKHPFDGTLKGEALPNGPYVFVVKPAPGYDAIRGRVVLLR